MTALALMGVLLSASPCVGTDADGAPFPTCFDPGNGLELGLAGFGRAQAGDLHLGPVLHGGILLRTERESVSKEGTRWFNEHRLLHARLQPDQAQRTLEVTGYQGNYRRHLKEGFLLVPSTPPIRLPFPFDVSVNLTALRYERRVFEGTGFSVETVRAAILLDPLRSPTGAVRLAFGPAASHALRVRDAESISQEFSPLTAGLLELIAETDDGWWNLRATALMAYVFTPDGTSFVRVRAEGALDRLILAVNDQPVALRLAGSYVRSDAGVLHRSEWTASVGLVLRLFSPAPRQRE